MLSPVVCSVLCCEHQRPFKSTRHSLYCCVTSLFAEQSSDPHLLLANKDALLRSRRAFHNVTQLRSSWIVHRSVNKWRTRTCKSTYLQELCLVQPKLNCLSMVSKQRVEPNTVDLCTTVTLKVLLRCHDTLSQFWFKIVVSNSGRLTFNTWIF